jgi:hypothetical protein
MQTNQKVMISEVNVTTGKLAMALAEMDQRVNDVQDMVFDDEGEDSPSN